MTNNNERYIPIIAVGAVDILGLKTLLNKGDECVSAMNAAGLFVKNSSVRDYFEEKSLKIKAGTMYDFDEYFGDSVYFYGTENLDIRAQVNMLAIKCASLVAIGLEYGFLVRAGIATGDLRIKTINLYGDKTREIRIGTSMAKAHLLQDYQEWIGVAINTKYIPTDINRVYYHVPLKEQNIFDKDEVQAANWVRMLVDTFGKDKIQILNVIKDRVNKIDDFSKKEVAIKLKNTNDFVEYVFNNEKYLI